MGILLKADIKNFFHSLKDYLERRSQLIRRFPPGVFIWGSRARSSLLVEGSKVLLYLSRNRFNNGGVVLYGELLRPFETSERYWPEGVWNIVLPIKVLKFAKGVVERPDDPASWRLVDRNKLAELGVKVLPGIQKIDDDLIERIASLI